MLLDSRPICCLGASVIGLVCVFFYGGYGLSVNVSRNIKLSRVAVLNMVSPQRVERVYSNVRQVFIIGLRVLELFINFQV